MTLKKGNIPWNKNLTKETDERVKQYGIKGSKTRKESGILKGKNNSNFGKHQSEEQKRKMVETRRRNGTYYSGENHPMWGKHQSDEAKKKISLTHKGDIGCWKGKHLSEEHRKNISNAHKGIKMPPFSEEHRKKLSESKKGKKLSEETLIRVRLKRKPKTEETKNKFRILFKGQHHCPRTEFKKGQMPHNKGKTKENYEPLKRTSKKMVEIMKTRVCPKKDTKIEVKIQNFLKLLGIEFFTHQYIQDIEQGYQCDILIPSTKTIIECDGDYWHGFPEKYPVPTERQLKQKEKDRIRTKELEEKGYRVIRLWEHEIKELNLMDFEGILINLLGKYIEPKQRIN